MLRCNFINVYYHQGACQFKLPLPLLDFDDDDDNDDDDRGLVTPHCKLPLTTMMTCTWGSMPFEAADNYDSMITST
jgi:hypothetical protein